MTYFSHPGHQDKLGVAETKLLHTLHWMLLEAPQDCSNDRFGGDRGSSWGGSGSAFIHQAENQGSPGHPRPSATNDEEENNRRKFFQNSMATVELFVFLFAPLVHRIKVSRTSVGYCVEIPLSTETVIQPFQCREQSLYNQAGTKAHKSEVRHFQALGISKI